MACEYVIKINKEFGQTPILSEEEFMTLLKTVNADFSNTDNKEIMSQIIQYLAKSSSARYALETREEIEEHIKQKSEDTKNAIKLTSLDPDILTSADYNFSAHDSTISGCTLIERISNGGLGLRMATDKTAFINAYVDNEIKRDPSKSAEQLMDEAEKIVEQWKLLSNDGMILHSFFPVAFYAIMKDSSSGGGVLNFKEKLQKYKYKDDKGEEHSLLERFDKDNLSEIASQISKITFYLATQTKAIREPKQSPLRSVYLRAPIKASIQDDVGAKYVGVHIDNIYIGKDNRPFVFNYKFSQNPYSSWAKNKKEKYRREIGIIKEVLEQNGVNTEGGEFWNIPIQIVYNDDGKITGFTFKGSTIENIGEPYNARDTTSPITKAHEEAKEKFFDQNIKPELSKIKKVSFNEDLSNGESLLKLINPKFNAHVTGLNISAQGWIMQHRGTHVVKPKSGIGWDVIMPDGTTHHINDNSSLKENKELLDFVQGNLEELAKELPVITQTLIDSIMRSYETGHVGFSGFGFGESAGFLERSLDKYFEYSEDSGKKTYTWQMVNNDTLNQLGVILFQNKTTGQTDVVSICPYKLDERIPVDYDQNSLMGMHEMDTKSPTTLQSCYGDMDCIRVMDIMNSVIHQIPDIKLGSINVYSPYFAGTRIQHSAKYISREYNNIVKYINKKFNTEFKPYFKQNNFINEYNVILQLSEHVFERNTVDALMNAQDMASRFNELKTLTRQLEMEFFRSSDPDRIKNFQTSSDPKKRLAFDIYSNAMAWIFRYSGGDHLQVKHIESLYRNILATYANPDENLRLVANVFNTALNESASEFLELYQPFRKQIMDFEAKKGVSYFDRTIIGSTESVFKKMFKRDMVSGENLWMMVDPYSDEDSAAAGLDEDERTFLKQYLFFIAKIRARSTGYKFEFKNENDPALVAYMKNAENKYFVAPLTRASNIKHTAETMFDKSKQIINRCSSIEKLKSLMQDMDKGPKDSITGTTPSKSIYDLGENPLSAHKTLMYSQDEENRASLLSMHPESYFEIDLGNIAALYSSQQVWYEKMVDVEFQAKAMLFNMYMLGDGNGKRTKEIMHESQNALEEFVKVNLYGQSVMSEYGKKATAIMQMPRKLMTSLYIAGNIRSMFRDTFLGVMQNTMRTLTHYNTNLITANVYKAYGEVLQNMLTSDRALNKLSELCLRYRLSNCDTAAIAERAKRGTGGLMNPYTASFGTLRAPDFLNRMVLFTARCMQDGCWDAFDMVDGKLVYDPRKDERFRDYFDGAKGSKEYLAAKSRYFTAVLEYNNTHKQSKPINIAEDLLPEPYTDKEIKSIKEFSDGIYGAYDKSQKARYERLFLGNQLGVFTTWFNGHVVNWLRQPGYYSSHYTSLNENGEPIIKKSDAGNELYFDDNGGIVEKIDNKYYDCVTGEEVQNDGNCPVVEDVPIFVQGTLYTFRDIWKILKQGDMSAEMWKTKIWAAQTNRENLKRLFGDMFMMLLYGLLFGAVLTPGYKEHKKKKKSDNVIADGMTELFYYSGRSAFDDFFGPFAIMQFILNDMGPSTVGSNIKFIQNASKLMFGKQSFIAFLYGNMPIFKSFKDTAKIADPDSFKTRSADD